jgi:nicotinamide-nucleotide amidase
MIAEILSIGNELTIGQAANRADLLLVTGGLGPTPDDLTREALADAMGVELILHDASMRQIEAYFQARHRPMHTANRNQALCPRGATPLENTNGTAPGIRARMGRMEIYVMPGVPREMKTMFEQCVAPCLPPPGERTISQKTLKSFGMSESEVGQRIGDLMTRGRNPTVGTSAADLIISIRIHARGATPQEATTLAEADAAAVRERLGIAVFGAEDDELQDAVARLLIEQQKTIATAESCTGGLIVKRLTDVAGSSAYLMQALVTYSNESKSRLLDVPADLIRRHGAVSAEVARAMAVNARRIAATDYALSVTGIAGPTGATPDKPIGLVYVGLSDATDAVVKEMRFGDTLLRHEVRDRAVKSALNLLRLRLLKAT